MKYDETDEIKTLKNLRQKPVQIKSLFKNEDINSDIQLDLITIQETIKPIEKTLFDNKSLNLKITLNEDDSDDDLTPYDTSNDVPLSKTKQPAYLRDCLDGLV